MKSLPASRPPVFAILLLAAAALLSFTCEMQDQNDRERRKRESGWLSNFVLWQALGTNYSLTDNNDGTVTFRQLLYKEVRFTMILKKCAQGQVYRPAQNDCQGTGSSADGYGAQKFQYCDKDDRSCTVLQGTVPEYDILDGSGNSAAYSSCKAETFGGFSWQVAPELTHIFNLLESQTIYADLPEGHYWQSVITQGDRSRAIYRNFPGGSGGRESKTTQNYLLCAKI